MIALALTITGLTMIMVLSAATKFNHDWQAMREHCEFGDMDQLLDMRNDKQQWIMRHMISAMLGFAFIVYAVSAPSHATHDLLAKLVAVHVTFSLLSVFIESLFVMRIASVTTSK